MSPRLGRRARQEFRTLPCTLTFAGVVFWIFASSLYRQNLIVVTSWYVDEITPLPGAAVQAS
jgi:hypothetical protein